MDRNILIQETLDKIKLLPDVKIQEINDFAEFLLSKIDDFILLDETQKLTPDSKSFEYLKTEEDLYSVNDLKEEYNFITKRDKHTKMTRISKNVIVNELSDVPDEFVNEIIDFIKLLKSQKKSEKISTHLASEYVLGKEWLRPEEEEAWKNL